MEEEPGGMGLVLAGVSFLPVGFRPVGRFFVPLRYVSLADFYAKFSTVIDLAIYALVFVGVAQVTLGRRYPGRGGRALALGVGTALALGMALAEERWGFTIRSFGPVAAVLLALLFTMLVYRLLRYGGARAGTALALGYVLLFLICLALAPELFVWLGDRAPGLAFALTLLFVFALFGLLLALVSGGGGHRERRLERRIARALERDRENEGSPRAAKSERRALKKFLKPRSKRFSKENAHTLHDLESVEEAVREHGSEPDMRNRIAKKIRAFKPDWKRQREELRRIRQVTRRLKETDSERVSEDTRPDLGGVTPRAQDLLRARARSETRRLDLDGKAERLERAIQADVDRVFRHVTNAADYLDRGRVREALSEIQRAMRAERSLSELGRALRALWDYLARMSGSEIDIQKRLDADGPRQ